MPASFWIFLVLSIIAFLVLIDDHGETLEEFRESKGAKKRRKGLKLFAMWFGCIGSLIGTLVLGWESWCDAKENAEREKQYNSVTNQLAQVELEYKQATNAQVVATQAAAYAETASRKAQEAESKLPKNG